MAGPTDDNKHTPPQSPSTKGIVQALVREVKKHMEGIDADVQVTIVMENMILMFIFLRNWLLNKNLHGLNFLKMLGLEQPLVNSLILFLFGRWNMARNILMTYHKLGLL
jgi:hypothetical protein